MTELAAGKRSEAGNIGSSDEVTLNQVLLRINALAPVVARQAPGMDQDRRLPEEVVSALRSAGIYRMLVPRRYGGLELDATKALGALSALARLDGSVGWNAMIGLTGSLAPFLVNPTLCEEIFRERENPIIVGSGRPAGTADRVPGGWRVSGVWPFVSGCHNADWIAGTCVMTEGGAPIDAADVPGPMTRSFLLPAHRWEIRDTWHTFGLRGTGSDDVALTDMFVPDERFFEFPFGASFAPDPVFGRFPELVVLSHAAVAVGIAEGAIADLVNLAKAGVQQAFMATPLVETDRFKEGLARLDADLKAARALLQAEIANIWQTAHPAVGKDMSRVAEQVQAGVWISAACIRVAEGCFELAGTRAIYESSPLQRRVRDLQVAAQHMIAHPRQYVAAGAVVLARLS